MSRAVGFGTTGFCQAFTGGDVARRSEELGFDVQLFGENHAMAPDVFGEMRSAVDTTAKHRMVALSRSNLGRRLFQRFRRNLSKISAKRLKRPNLRGILPKSAGFRRFLPLAFLREARCHH